MTCGTPQGSPVSASLFTVYTSAMMKEAEEGEDMQGRSSLQRGSDRATSVFSALLYIDDDEERASIDDGQSTRGGMAGSFGADWTNRPPQWLVQC